MNKYGQVDLMYRNTVIITTTPESSILVKSFIGNSWQTKMRVDKFLSDIAGVDVWVGKG